MKRLALLCLPLVVGAAQADVNPYFKWELAPTFAQLSHPPSSTDLVQGFATTTESGILSNQILNESAYPFNFGIIDATNEVYSMLMNQGSAPCLYDQFPGIGQASDGFYCCPSFAGGHPGVFVDGLANGPLDGILRDFARASLVVRFGFTTPTNIGYLRVLGGNFLNLDGRVFQHYDVWASTDGLGDLGTYTLVAASVRTGEFGQLFNTGLWAGSLTELHNFDSKYLVQGCTDLRIVFYCVSNTQGAFRDPWNGAANETDAAYLSCDMDPEDVDGLRKAIEAPIIREIDVFPPGVGTPWGDIDYNGKRDMIDAAAFQVCASADLTTGGCYRFDLDEDDFLTGADVTLFGALMTGL
ncbi:MAG: hypothetical protein IPM18_17560 [Phycisphaerales bacterium]|nr:hypothetical protein [Phycisphaerales bacterium]